MRPLRLSLPVPAGNMSVFVDQTRRALQQIEAASHVPYVQLPRFTVGKLPSAASAEGSLIYVPDESGGPVTAFSDGTNWLRVTDRAVVS